MKPLTRSRAIQTASARDRRFCHGDQAQHSRYLTVVSQLIGALAYFNCDTSSVALRMRIYSTCIGDGRFSAPIRSSSRAAQQLGKMKQREAVEIVRPLEPVNGLYPSSTRARRDGDRSP